MQFFCQNYVFIKVLFYNILSIISENILAKFTCLVQKNNNLLFFSYERAAEVLSFNTTKTVNLSYQNKALNIYNKCVSMHICNNAINAIMYSQFCKIIIIIIIIMFH